MLEPTEFEALEVEATEPAFDKDTYQTPDMILDRVRLVMGWIDLDPASNDQANERVRANAYYTKETGGLLSQWFGKVFLNPPFSRGNIDTFVLHWCKERREGRITESIMVTNNATDTKWFREAMSVSDAVCFPKRIAFLSPLTGLPIKGNRNAQAIFYTGPNVDKFCAAFGDLGPVLQESSAFTFAPSKVAA